MDGSRGWRPWQLSTALFCMCMSKISKGAGVESVKEDQWVEWASHNLALGISEHDVIGELMKGGFEASDANRVLNKIKASPIYRASVRIAGDVLKWTRLSEALLEMESQAVDFSRLPRVSGLSSEEFHRSYYAANRPVIIEDVVRDWPAVSKWHLDFFRSYYGRETVTYQSGRSSDDYRDSFIEHPVQSTFSEYLDLIEKNETTNKYYLIAHDRLLDKAPFKTLLADINFDSRYLDGRVTHDRVFFFLGPAGCMTPMHRDLGNVYLAQIKGRKLVKMIPSKQMHLVYNEIGYHTEVDFENFSFDNFPLLKKAHIIEEVINPGDLLFIPVGWWHSVKSLDTTISITGTNFNWNNSIRPIF